MDSEHRSVIPYRWYYAGLVAIFFLFWGLWYVEVVEVNEGLRTFPSKIMAESGDWIIPRLGHTAYLNKPPLIYWIIGGVYKATGKVNSFMGHLPVVLFSITTAVLLFFIIRREQDAEHAFWSAIVLVSMYYFMHKSQRAEIDSVLTFFILAGVYGIWRVYEADKGIIPWGIVQGAAWGFGAMLKGPAILPYMMAALFFGALVWRSRWKRGLVAILLSLIFIAGMLVPWGMAVARRMGGWSVLVDKLQEQSVRRVFEASEINSGPVYYYIYKLAGAMLPWSWLALGWFDRRLWREGANRFFRFVGYFSLTSLVCFSLFRGKETEYVLPLFPFAAYLFIGAHFFHLKTMPPKFISAAQRFILGLIAAGIVLSPLALVTSWRVWLMKHVYMMAGMGVMALTGLALFKVVIQGNRRMWVALLVVVMIFFQISYMDSRRIYMAEEWSALSAAEFIRSRGIKPVYFCEMNWAHFHFYLWDLSQGSCTRKDMERLTGEWGVIHIVLKDNRLDEIKKAYPNLDFVKEADVGKNGILVKIARSSLQYKL